MIERALLVAMSCLSIAACGEPTDDRDLPSAGAGGKADEIAGDAGAAGEDAGAPGVDAGAPAELALEVDCHLGPPIGITLDVLVFIDPTTENRTIHVEDGFASPPKSLDLAVDSFETTPDDFLLYLGQEFALQIDLLTSTDGENLALFASSLVDDGRNFPLLCQLNP
jgi:hypothetical protein